VLALRTVTYCTENEGTPIQERLRSYYNLLDANLLTLGGGLTTRFIKKLPLGKTPEVNQLLPVSVVPLTAELVLTWNKMVQPLIDLHYRHDGDLDLKKVDRKIRADVGWNWKNLLKLGWIQTEQSRVLQGQGVGEAVGYSIVATSLEGQIFPIGMLLGVPKFQTTIDSRTSHRNLVWFLSNAPIEVFEKLIPCSPAPTSLAESLLDSAIVDALSRYGINEMLLHADPKGGDKLLHFYDKKCGMERLSEKNGPVSRTRRSDISRYFYFSPPGAESFCSKFDTLR